MKLRALMVACAVLGLAARAAAGPARAGEARMRRADDAANNAIDVDSPQSEDIPSTGSEDKPSTESTTAASESSVSTDSTPAPDPSPSTPADSDPALTLPPRAANATDAAAQDAAAKEEQTDGEDEFEQEFAGEMQSPSTSQGSNVFSLLNLVGQLFPGSSGSNVRVRRLFNNFIFNNQRAVSSLESYITNNLIKPRRRQDNDNVIDIDEYYSNSISEEESSEESSEVADKPEISKDKPKEKPQAAQPGKPKEDASDTDKNTAAEESVEIVVSEKQSAEDNESGSDYEDEPPGGGDGEGGGILGLIAGLSGGGDGQSDLGSLLAAVSGIVVNLSGDGVDLNSLIAGGLGLFVGLLSEGMENPGSVVAGYLATSLDTLSGGGSKNNGAFFGNFVSRLLKGISAAGGGGDGKTPATTQNPLRALKSGVARAVLQFVTSAVGAASTGSS